jgi:hypothetical protein
MRLLRELSRRKLRTSLTVIRMRDGLIAGDERAAEIGAVAA